MTTQLKNGDVVSWCYRDVDVKWSFEPYYR